MTHKKLLEAEPVACTLSGGEFADRERAWRRLLEQSLVDARRVPNGLQLSVHPVSAQTLAQLVELERECCRWIHFELDCATVTMTADADRELMLVDMFHGALAGDDRH